MLATPFFTKLVIGWGFLIIAVFIAGLLVIKYGKFPTHYEPEEILPVDEFENKLS